MSSIRRRRMALSFPLVYASRRDAGTFFKSVLLQALRALCWYRGGRAGEREIPAALRTLREGVTAARSGTQRLLDHSNDTVRMFAVKAAETLLAMFYLGPDELCGRAALTFTLLGVPHPHPILIAARVEQEGRALVRAIAERCAGQALVK